MEIIMPQSQSGNVPAFLAKLWKMVDSPETDLLIAWGDDGASFIIKHQAQFARDMLPYYYKHSNMASFVRQLNMYGFHKVISVDSGGLKAEKDEQEFAHPYFLRGQEHLLEHIKRKVSVGGRAASAAGGASFLPSIKSEKVNEVLSEVSQIKDRQEDLDTKLDTMKHENEALWREVLSLRQKHSQQQKIVNKLIQFLVALVQPSRMTGMKRRYVPGTQLAIEDGEKAQKEPRMNPSPGPQIKDITNETTETCEANVQLDELLAKAHSPMPVVSSPCPSVPVVTTPVLDQTSAEQARTSMPQYTYTVPITTSQSASTSQATQSKYRLVDPASLNPAIKAPVNTQVSQANSSSSGGKSTIKRPALLRELSKEDVDTDISSMQRELDNLKDLLSGQITLDTSLVTSLFSPDDNLSTINLFNDSLMANMNQTKEEAAQPPDSKNDLKLVTYNPSLFELADDDFDVKPLFKQGNNDDGNLNTPLPQDLNTPLPQEETMDPMKYITGR